MKRKMKKTLAALLTLSICFSTINIEAMAEEVAIETQTEQDEIETQTDEDGSDSQIGQDESDSQTDEDESDSKAEEDESGSQTEQDEMDSKTDEDEADSGDDAVAKDITGWDGVTTESVYEGGNFKVTFSLSGYWNGGYNAGVKVENTGNTVIENWTLEFGYGGTISNIWNATINSSQNGNYIIKNAGWNQDIAAGSSIEFGISGQEDFPGFPKKYALLGSSASVAEEDYSIAYRLDSDWGGGFTGSVSITNNTDSTIEDWYLEFDFERNITYIWNAAIESHSEKHYVIKNVGYNANINAGQTISFGFSGQEGNSTDQPTDYKLYSYEMYARENSDDLDADGDGLTDYEEINITLTDPYEADTDGDGIIDSKDDIDGDGINNRDEIDLGTDPLNSDTDNDNLTDYEELYEYSTDPLQEDTDGDGLTDYDDVKLGFSPLLKDTDGNGIIDSEERVYQTVTEQLKNPKNEGVTAVSVSLNIKGNAEKNVGIEDVYEFDKLSSGVVGLIGVPVEIGCDTEFEQAEITFYYDVNALGDTKEEDLSIMWYDEDNCWYQILDEDSVVDTQNHTVTYTTTHFSTYMLVDSKEWYEAWRENIDYRNSSSGDTEKNYFDIAFVVDVSGSMAWDNIKMAKKAVNNFIDTMQVNDEAAIISFNKLGFLNQDFTNNKNKLKSAVSSLSTNGGTDVNNGLLMAISTFENHECGKQNIIVLICDGNVNYVQSTVDTCIADDIQIYAVNVFSASAHELLQKMTSQTGGEYYYASSANEIETVFADVVKDTTEQIDPTDTDGDGLYDIFETAGMRLTNGQIIYTDPANPDTDGDGLTDYQETGIVYNVDDRYVGSNHILGLRYFNMRSYPDQQDSDNDGMTDDVDDRPLMAEVYEVAKLNSKFSDYYLNIVGDNGLTYYGGDQGWWSDKTPYQPKDGNGTEDEKKSKDKYYRLWRMGCGTVAMSDAELYLMLQNSGYSLSVPAAFDENIQQTGICKKDAYRDYLEQMYETRYTIDGDIVSINIGLDPWTMEREFSDFLKVNNSSSTNVKWSRYGWAAGITKKQEILNEIERMLNADMPVVFSYYSFAGKEIILYDSIQNAKNNAKVRDDGKEQKSINSHYMTITGLYKFSSVQPWNYKYILEVVSWGEIYYIDYDEYAKKLDYVSNILSVY